MSKPRHELMIPEPCRHCQNPARLRIRGLCRTCHNDRTIRESYPYWVPCDHCGQARKVTNRWGLCGKCQVKRAVVRRYGLYPSSLEPPSDDPTSRAIRALLASARPWVYPPAWQLPKCEHGLDDGTCPACEKRQRAVLVMEPNTDQEDDDSYTTDED